MVNDDGLLLSREGILKALNKGLSHYTYAVCDRHKHVTKAQLAHCKPLIEKQLLSQDGVKACIDSIIKREVSEAKKQERERIISEIEAMDKRHTASFVLQALKEDK